MSAMCCHEFHVLNDRAVMSVPCHVSAHKHLALFLVKAALDDFDSRVHPLDVGVKELEERPELGKVAWRACATRKIYGDDHVKWRWPTMSHHTALLYTYTYPGYILVDVFT